LLVLLCANSANRSKVETPFNPIEMSIVAKTDKDGRWCAEPIFEATIKNSAASPVWLDLGEAASYLVVTSYSACQSTTGAGSCEGSASGKTHDWGSVEHLRSAAATLLKPGESATRFIRLEDVHLKAGRTTVDVTVRIHGTQDLADSKVHTYKPKATGTLVVRRVGHCLEVRRLTRRRLSRPQE
jgi:hypothetical protein